MIYTITILRKPFKVDNIISALKMKELMIREINNLFKGSSLLEHKSVGLQTDTPFSP